MNFNPSALCFIMVLFVLFVHLLVYHSIYLSSVQCFGVSAGLSNDVLSQRIMNMRNPKGSRVRAAHDGPDCVGLRHRIYLPPFWKRTAGPTHTHTLHCTALHCVCALVCARPVTPEKRSEAIAHRYSGMHLHACCPPSCVCACVRACVRAYVRACEHTAESAKNRTRPTNFPKTPINQTSPSLLAMHYLPFDRTN